MNTLYYWKVPKLVFCAIVLLFGWGISGSIQNDLADFSENVLRICANYARLKEDQQKVLAGWIDEILQSKPLALTTRFQLKRCRKSLRDQLNNKVNIKDRFIKFMFERRIRNFGEECRQLSTVKDSLNIGKEELEELRKFTEETEAEKASNSKFSDLYFSEFDGNADAGFLGNHNNLLDRFGSPIVNEGPQSPQSNKPTEQVKHIQPYGPYSDYLGDDGIPIVMETENFILKHDSLLLLVPINLPMHMNYVKMPLPKLEPQPDIMSLEYIISPMEKQIGGIDELFKDETEYSRHSQRSTVEFEIIDEKLDAFDSSESSSPSLTESELSDLDSVALPSVSDERGRSKRSKNGSMSADYSEESNKKDINFEKNRSPYAKRAANKSFSLSKELSSSESPDESELSETSEESETASTEESESGRSSANEGYSARNDQDSDDISDFSESSTAESQGSEDDDTDTDTDTDTDYS
ncbi:putative signal peptide protein [Cryptosporidium canis]|nr:putative signal peptide protein [Cryptosporidium canis]